MEGKGRMKVAFMSGVIMNDVRVRTTVERKKLGSTNALAVFCR